MIEIDEVKKIILKHKSCRSPHNVGKGIYLSCLFMVLAEVQNKKPLDAWKDIENDV